MFAILGDIEIEVAGGLVGMEWRETSDWAEHARIAGKPLLEWVGDGLTEYTLDILLHPMLGDPDARLQEMKAAKAQHLPLKLVFGNGDYPGAYAITDISATPQRAMADGRIFTANLRVTLREFVGEIRDQSRPRGLLSRSLSTEPVAPDVLTQVLQPKSVLNTVLGNARTASTLLRSGLELFNATKRLVSDPVAQLSQIPRLLNATRDVLVPLGEYLGMAEQLENGRELISAASGATADVLSARFWLTGILGIAMQFSSPVKKYTTEESYYSGWGYTRSTWIYADTFDEAWDMGVLWALERDAADKAKLKESA